MGVSQFCYESEPNQARLESHVLLAKPSHLLQEGLTWARGQRCDLLIPVVNTVVLELGVEVRYIALPELLTLSFDDRRVTGDAEDDCSREQTFGNSQATRGLGASESAQQLDVFDRRVVDVAQLSSLEGCENQCDEIVSVFHDPAVGIEKSGLYLLAGLINEGPGSCVVHRAWWFLGGLPHDPDLGGEGIEDFVVTEWTASVLLA